MTSCFIPGCTRPAVGDTHDATGQPDLLVTSERRCAPCALEDVNAEVTALTRYQAALYHLEGS